MVEVYGSYECKVDAKGRLMVPSSVKKQMAPILQDGFILKRSIFQPCLELYPLGEWKQLIGRMNKLNKFNKKNNDFVRKFTAGVKTVEVDSNGRLLIPKDLIGYAGIEKEIIFSSVLNIIEIWDKKKYEEAIGQDDEDFASLAEEIMGNEDVNGIS